MKFLRPILIGLLLMLPSSVTSAESLLPEYEIKAAFIYNFGKFIEWPEMVSGPSAPEYFHICILGKDPFGEKMNEIEGKTIKGLTVKVSRASSIEEILDSPGCRVLFISDSEINRLADILGKIKKYPILTVADLENAMDLGVMINLRTLGDRIRFEINLKAASNAGIKINSKMLKLAVKITE
ncbi:MAG: YfiR family protein [Desulfobacteraceae bacterium]|nr:YfiR family protein [Desulfobacteraceae bacterium]